MSDQYSRKELIKHLLENPYKFFFTLGILFFLGGTSIWMIHFFDEDFYPIAIHRYCVINGFMFSFIPGFLMTAAPRFLKAPFLRFGEAVFYLLTTIIGFVLVFSIVDVVHWVSIVQSLILLGFLIIRIENRKQNAPYQFVFIIVGLVINILYSSLRLIDWNPPIEVNEFLPLALIVMGVGSRFVPSFMGHDKKLPSMALVNVVILIVLFSLFVEERFANIIYFSLTLLWGFAQCSLYRLPKVRSALAWGTWISAWNLILSFGAVLLDNGKGIHLTHSLFIGTFVLLVFLVATRVLVAHGSDDKSLENSKVLWFLIIMVEIGMTTRVSAIYLPSTYTNHLGYSSFLLVLAILVWCKKYLSQMLIVGILLIPLTGYSNVAEIFQYQGTWKKSISTGLGDCKKVTLNALVPLAAKKGKLFTYRHSLQVFRGEDCVKRSDVWNVEAVMESDFDQKNLKNLTLSKYGIVTNKKSAGPSFGLFMKAQLNQRIVSIDSFYRDELLQRAQEMDVFRRDPDAKDETKSLKTGQKLVDALFMLGP